MDWDVSYRYKVMAIYQELNGVKLVVFNFDDCTMLVCHLFLLWKE